MGERLTAWWNNVEEIYMPMGRILLKGIIVMFLMSAILSTGSPWYNSMPIKEIIIFKIGMLLLVLCYVYPDIKQICKYLKGLFSTEGDKKI